MSNRLLWLLAGCVWSASAASLGDADAQALLKQSDLRRNGWSSYVGRVKITNYESGKADEEHLYQVSQKGADKTHVEFLSPREKGTLPADARRRHVGLFAGHQPAGPDHAARAIDRRCIER
jgi:hypothetical protein